MKKDPLILVVEDEPAMRQAAITKLSMEGFAVLEAHDGEEGLKQATDHHPDLILLDVLMPKMDGMTMMKALRAKDAWGKKVPIIILTNLRADDKITKDVAKEEPSYYLIKANWSIEDIITKIREVLKLDGK